jgi:hypothetical protein
MSLFDSLSLPVSFEADYYASDAWDERKKEIEIEAQRQNANFYIHIILMVLKQTIEEITYNVFALNVTLT